MAVDTAAKRFSMMGFSDPIQQVMDPPDGSVAAADRSSFLLLYRGIAAGSIPFNQALARNCNVYLGSWPNQPERA